MPNIMHSTPPQPPRFRALLGCAGLAGGGILGSFLGIGVAYLDLRGVELAGTQIVLYPIYAIPGFMIGATAGLIGALLLRRKTFGNAALGWLIVIAIACLAFFGFRFLAGFYNY